MAITQTTVDLKWTAAADNVAVTNYKVYRKIPRVLNPSFIADVGNVLSYTVINLTPDTEYDFIIRAEDAAGNISDDSNIVNTKTLI